MPLGPPIPLWRMCLAMAEYWANHKYQPFF
jgi:hypothetical protein